MTVSAHDVARELRRRASRAGNLKIQKLLYYCQGWHLAWTGKPLFVENIEAWANGPVVADFWHAEDKDRPGPPATALDGRGLEILRFVLGRYGELNGPELVQLTHTEAPWLDASRTDRYNPPITREALENYFSRTDGMEEEGEQAAELRHRGDYYSLAPKMMTAARRVLVDEARLQARSGRPLGD